MVSSGRPFSTLIYTAFPLGRPGTISMSSCTTWLSPLRKTYASGTPLTVPTSTWRMPLAHCCLRPKWSATWELQEQISHNSQVALHFGRKQQCANGILQVEVGTVSGVPLAYVFLRGDNQVVQLLIEIVPGRPKGKAV